jgi:hypothetical protein
MLNQPQENSEVTMGIESYEVEWRDANGAWHTVKTGLTESEADACTAQYKDWTIRILKVVRTVVRLVEAGESAEN